jgi:conjugative relaxase-like TrwC/TraI family protein
LLTISKALSSAQAQTYHAKEFTSAEQNYWKQDGAVVGEWQGKLAERFRRAGAVDAQHFARLSEGQNPISGEQLVHHRSGQSYTTADGTTIKPVEHRAGWDATFSAAKSVSLTALVGGDDRVREAHRQAVTAALTELERYTQARIGGNHAAETTGKFIAAKFEHDTARPVNGYAAPQLHTHAVVFNMTQREDGSTRAIQPKSLFDSQQFATAVYQAELTFRLRNLGYEIEAGKKGAPEIKGYSPEYLDASSPRRQQIEQAMAESGFSGPEAAQIAAHNTRDKKKFVPQPRLWKLTASLPRSSAIRPTGLFERPTNEFMRRDRIECPTRPSARRKPSPMPRNATSSARRSSTSATSCAMRFAAAWETSPSARYATTSSTATLSANSKQ